MPPEQLTDSDPENVGAIGVLRQGVELLAGEVATAIVPDDVARRVRSAGDPRVKDEVTRGALTAQRRATFKRRAVMAPLRHVIGRFRGPVQKRRVEEEFDEEPRLVVKTAIG